MSESRTVRELLNRLDSAGASVPEELTSELRHLIQKRELEVHDLESRLAENTRELSRARTSLDEFNRLTQEFVSVCAHDLRSPTNSILSFLDIMTHDGDSMTPQERRSIYERMERAGRHMLNLIADLLEMVQIESGKYSLKTEPLALSSLCKDVLQNMQGSFKAKDIHNSFHVGHGELRVNMDRQKGIQILTNLLSNALKFTPRGGRVDLGLDVQGKIMVLEVKDSGPGIPDDELQKVFDRFAKLSTKATEGEKGSGLGLTIVKQLLDLHHGDITVRSKLGQGTSFIITLPVAESPQLLKLFSGKR